MAKKVAKRIQILNQKIEQDKLYALKEGLETVKELKSAKHTL